MNCSKCNNQLTDTSSPFCPFCGAAQSPTVPDSVAPAPADSAQTDVPGAAGQNEEPALHPLTEEAIAGAPMGGTATATPVSPVSPGAANPMTPPHMAAPPFPPANPFDAAQVPQKKKMPTWAIVLIAAGIMLVLTVCCCLAMWAAFGDDFMEGFEEGFEAGMQQSELRLADPAPTFTFDDDSDDGDDVDSDTDVNLATDGSAALIQTWIDDNRAELDLISEAALAMMGEGARADFEAADGEFIFIYSYGDNFPSQGLVGMLETILDVSEGLYEEIATEFAGEIGIDSMTITIRYYQHGELLISESFQSR